MSRLILGQVASIQYTQLNWVFASKEATRPEWSRLSRASPDGVGRPGGLHSYKEWSRPSESGKPVGAGSEDECVGPDVLALADSR